MSVVWNQTATAVSRDAPDREVRLRIAAMRLGPDPVIKVEYRAGCGIQ